MGHISWEAYYSEQVRRAVTYLHVRWTPERAYTFRAICFYHYVMGHIKRNHHV